MDVKPNIVIIGGGAAGLELTTTLGRSLGKKKKANITLIDSSLTHIWKPLFHEVAVGSLDSNNHALNYIHHANKNFYHFQLGKVKAIDSKKKQVTLEEIKDNDNTAILESRIVQYDYLVVAVGSVANTYNIPGAQKNCTFLDTLNEAEKFHTHLINQVLKFRQDKTKRKLKISIIGAGASGVELAAELTTAFESMKKNNILQSTSHLTVNLIEAGDRILSMLPKKFSINVSRQLESLNIKILTNEKVIKINNKGIETRNGNFIESDINLWVAGIKAPAWLKENTSLETNKANQIKINPTLLSKSDPNVFALGDCAECFSNNQPVPARAQTAHQQASHLVKNIKRKLQNRECIEYRYVDYGSLVNLSGAKSQGFVMGKFFKRLSIEGKTAAFIYWSLYKMHQFKIHGLFKVITIMISSSFSCKTKPRLKLH